jgi:hypothetical protein
MDHHDTENAKVSATEHVAFLSYWLSMYILCTRSIQVAKGYKTLTIQFHEGKNICLSKLILGFLYESLHLGVSGIRSYQSWSSLIIPGPIWLFQL